jgi:drug/metabolite transporter (DMT)-like permease
MGPPAPPQAAPEPPPPPPPPPQGLWGRSGLRTPPAKATVLLYIAAIFLGYCFSLLINGAAGRLFKPRFALPAPAAPGADPLTPLGLVVLVLDPMFLLASFRLLACLALTGGMTLAGDTPWATGVGEEGTAVSASAMALTPAMAVPIVVGVCNAGGYLFYLALTARGGSAIWSALVGLYIVFPVAYGILFKGEARTAQKLWGVAVCACASVLLGWSEEQKDAVSLVPWWSNALLFGVCVSLWGACDGLSAFMGRDLHLWWVSLLTGVGFGAVALLCALVAFFITGTQDTAAAPVAPNATAVASAAAAAAAAAAASSIPVGWGYLLMAVAQVSGVAAWFLSVKLGVLAEASAFLPIISLYTMGASLLAVPILGERGLPAVYWVGVAVGITGILLIAYADGGGGGADSSGRQQLQEEQDGSSGTSPTPMLGVAVGDAK